MTLPAGVTGVKSMKQVFIIDIEFRVLLGHTKAPENTRAYQITIVQLQGLD